MLKQKWSGERVDPSVNGSAMLEHLHRYTIAVDLANGKKVLDVACGEGYGCALIAKTALQVTGIDIDENTIRNAKEKYNSGNIEFKQGSLLALPVDNNSIDLITCFETLEHLSDHSTALKEIKRVLKNDGILIISTPDKLIYTDNGGHENQFHEKELYEKEFKELIRSNFTSTSFLVQNSLPSSIIVSDNPHPGIKSYSGDYENIRENPGFIPVYWIAMASNQILPQINSSIFQHNETLSQLLFNEALAVKETPTYRLGNFLLYPIKALFSIFKK